MHGLRIPFRVDRLSFRTSPIHSREPPRRRFADRALSSAPGTASASENEPAVAGAQARYRDGTFVRHGQARGSFECSGLVFEDYRVRVGTIDFTDASRACFFPVGAPGLFRQYNALADFVETANTISLPRYSEAGGGSAVCPVGNAGRAANLHPAAGADQRQAHLMTVF